MHRPETWGYIQFAAGPAGRRVSFQPDPTAAARYLLYQIQYGQQAWRQRHGRYARTLADLGGITPEAAGLAGPVRLESDGQSFTVSAPVRLPDGRVITLSVDDEARCRQHESGQPR
jgi:hypothetical protein